jgi:hypothetical protein
MSNCIEINVQIPQAQIKLSSNADELDTDGLFDLSWTAYENADSYSVYVSDDNITEINQNTTLIYDDISNLTILISINSGHYYFIVAANNNYSEIISNSLEIQVELHPINNDDNLDIYTIFDEIEQNPLFVSCSILFVLIMIGYVFLKIKF